MYPPVQKLKIVYDKDLFIYKSVLITSWKEKSPTATNKEMFDAFYMFNMSLTSRESDSFIQVAFSEKYSMMKALDFILSNKQNADFNFVVDNTVFCPENDLLEIKKKNRYGMFVFDPLEFKRKKGWY